MLNNNFAKIAFSVFIFAASTFSAYAQQEETQKELPIAAAYQIERRGNYLTEPNNNDYEILRRLGRSFNKEYPSDKSILNGASVIDITKFASKDFLKPITEKDLTEKQKKDAIELIDKYKSDFVSLNEQVANDKEAIVAKMVIDCDKAKKTADSIFGDQNLINKLKKEDVDQIKQNISPILENSKYIIALLGISNRGIFVNGKIETNPEKVKPEDISSLTISDYINQSALIYFAQSQKRNTVDEDYAKLQMLPQISMIESALKASELDLKKDILSNMSSEVIFYLNLEPSGDGNIPDIRLVSPVPDIKALINILPNFKKLCVQMGIFNEVKEDKFTTVKLSMFMLKGFAVYVGLVDDMLAIATGYNNLIDEMTHIASIKAKKAEELKHPLKQYQMHGKIRTKDFNKQLQRLLASPLLQNKIPPLPNMQFLDDIDDFTFSVSTKPENTKLSIEIPIIKNK